MPSGASHYHPLVATDRKTAPGLFTNVTPQAERGPRTDRLILGRYLDELAPRAVRDAGDEAVANGHKIALKWADLETNGSLAGMKESSLAGQFIHEFFGEGLGYKTRTEGDERWEVEHHRTLDGVQADALIGWLTATDADCEPRAVVELKGPRVHLDRDRSNGRTAVQQCWDYLDGLPGAQWGIVSNIVSFRLYERNHTPRRYEHFALQDLRDAQTFRRFFTLFSRSGLLKGIAGQQPFARSLLEQTDNRQRDVGDELYDAYRRNREELIRFLHDHRQMSLEESVSAAQILLDRVVFIAFCEDRHLLPEKSLERAYADLPAFTKITNPRWANYVSLFQSVDEGNEAHEIPAYNGGLFRKSVVDDLDLPDDLTKFFSTLGTYDFRDEVNLNVLGHLFEKSIVELEKLLEGDFFVDGSVSDRFAQMPKSAIRKRYGVYYTPPEFTSKISELAIDELIESRFRDIAEQMQLDPDEAEAPEYWEACFEELKAFRVVDPACGSGAFLFQAYEILESRYGQVLSHLEPENENGTTRREHDPVPDLILRNNLYGVDLSEEAVEITKLALWIKSARRGSTLSDLSHNIRSGNSLVDDREVDPRAFDWREAFPEVFDASEDEGFDAVIGNPPWERMKLQEREFFALSAPEIATASNAAERRRKIERLEKSNPELYKKYLEAQAQASAQLDYCRRSGRYPLTGKGDVNTYAVFTELAASLVSSDGRVGLLVPSGIATDHTTRNFFSSLTDSGRLRCLYDFENRRGIFPDIDGRMKFSILVFSGRAAPEAECDYVFFGHSISDLAERRRHVRLSGEDIALINPNTKTAPIFRSRRDAELTKRVYRRIPVLVDRSGKGERNDWGVSFLRMFDQTNDAELFVEAEELKRKRFRLEGNRFAKATKEYWPVYEAKMLQMYDHRAASVRVETDNWMRQGQTDESTLAEYGNPQHVPLPRWWVDRKHIMDVLGEDIEPALLCYKDVTSATNRRTMIASFVPVSGVVNSAPICRFDPSIDARLRCCFLANINSFAYDFIARQKVGNVHLNYYIVEQLPTLPPYKYEERAPWERKESLLKWVSERVLKLSCTAVDIVPLAEAAEFIGGDSHDGRVNRWKPQERAELMSQLDAAFFLLYGIEREDAEYMLSTFQGVNDPLPGLPGARSWADRILDEYDHLSSRSM